MRRSRRRNPTRARSFNHLIESAIRKVLLEGNEGDSSSNENTMIGAAGELWTAYFCVNPNDATGIKAADLDDWWKDEYGSSGDNVNTYNRATNSGSKLTIVQNKKIQKEAKEIAEMILSHQGLSSVDKEDCEDAAQSVGDDASGGQGDIGVNGVYYSLKVGGSVAGQQNLGTGDLAEEIDFNVENLIREALAEQVNAVEYDEDGNGNVTHNIASECSWDRKWWLEFREDIGDKWLEIESQWNSAKSTAPAAVKKKFRIKWKVGTLKTTTIKKNKADPAETNELVPSHIKSGSNWVPNPDAVLEWNDADDHSAGVKKWTRTCGKPEHWINSTYDATEGVVYDANDDIWCIAREKYGPKGNNFTTKVGSKVSTALVDSMSDSEKLWYVCSKVRANAALGEGGTTVWIGSSKMAKLYKKRLNKSTYKADLEGQERRDACMTTTVQMYPGLADIESEGDLGTLKYKMSGNTIYFASDNSPLFTAYVRRASGNAGSIWTLTLMIQSPQLQSNPTEQKKMFNSLDSFNLIGESAGVRRSFQKVITTLLLELDINFDDQGDPNEEEVQKAIDVVSNGTEGLPDPVQTASELPQDVDANGNPLPGHAKFEPSGELDQDDAQGPATEPPEPDSGEGEALAESRWLELAGLL